MRRIAVVTRYFPSSGEPAEGRSLYQTLRIASRSADIKVFYPNAVYPSWLRPPSRIYDKLDRGFSPPDVNVSYYDFPALPLLSRPLNARLAYRTLLPHVSAFSPDVILGCFLYPAGFAALRIGQRLGIPVVAMSTGSDINRIGDPISAWYTRVVLREADFLVTASEDLCKKAVAMGAAPAKARPLPNGCDLSTFRVMDRHGARQRLNIDPDFEAVVYVGRIDVKKGLRELVEAAAMLHPNRPALHVYLVGNGPDRNQLERLVLSHSASAYVHMVGGCAFDEVAVWMTAANLVTLPSYMEGFPNTVLEALACGRPVVATHVGGIPEIMSDACGRLVPPREAGKLAAAITAVLDRCWDPAVIAAQWSRSWSTRAEELLEIFDSVASGGQRVANAG